jgi:predicted CopG family antitoxin
MPKAQLAVFMGTKTISLSEDAYDRLKRRKREGESFNVVNRLAGERPLLDIVGTGQPDDGVEEAIENVRENLNGSTERPTKNLAERTFRRDIRKENQSTSHSSVSCYYPWREYTYSDK